MTNFAFYDGLSPRTAAVALTLVLACLAPAAADAQFVTDDFNACTLDPVWTFVDPLGLFDDPVMVGTYSEDAGVALTVPSGTRYQFWDGTDEPPYIIQAAADTNMTVEARFDSHLEALYLATEGIVIYESPTSWVRAEFYTRPDSLYRVAVDVGIMTTVHDITLPADVTAPISMRVTRDGDTWTQYWRDDGNYPTWTQVAAPFDYAMNVTGVGLYAGNNNERPGHTVVVDYFSNTPGVPAAEDSVRAPLDVTVVGGGSVIKNLDLATYGCDELVILTPVDSLGWAFDSWSGDLVGSDNPASIVMNGAAAVTASFVPTAICTLDVTLVGGGTVTLDPPGGIYNIGTTVTLTAGDVQGWAFNSWSGDLAGSTNPETLVMDANKAVTATFDPVIEYDLVVDASPPGGGTVTLDPPGGTYNNGTMVTLTATETEGWVFTGWTGDLASLANPDSVAVDSTMTVTAGFVQLAEYALTLTTTGNGSIVANPAPLPGGTYYEGTLVELTAVPDPDWQLDTWSGDLTGQASPDTILIDGPRSVTAEFGLIPPAFVTDDFNACTLDPVWTFVNPLGEFDDPVMVGTYTEDAGVSMTVPAGTRYQFWDGTDEPPHIIQAAADTDMTVEARFDSDLPALYLCTEGIVIYESPTSWVRAEFYTRPDGLYRAAVDVGIQTTVHDITLPADVTAPITMRITRQGDTWTQYWRDDGNYTAWTQVATPFNYAMNVTGTGLYVGNNNELPSHTIVVDYFSSTPGVPVDEDILRAPLDVTIAGGGGSVAKSPDLPTYGCDELVTLTATDALGWTFDSWSGAVVGTDNPTSLVMNGAAAVTAHYVPAVTCTLDVTLVGGGTVTLDPPGGVYNIGTSVTVTAGDTQGWVFNAWSGDLVGTTNPETLVMDANKAVTATFDPALQYDLVVDASPPAGGSVVLDPAGGSYNDGTVVTLTAVETEGWAFTGWTGDLASLANPDSVAVDSTMAVTAGFVQLAEYALSLSTTGNGTIVANPAPLPGGTYYDGTLVELTAVPDPDWQLDAWSGDLTGQASPDTILIDGPKSVAAAFGLIPPAVTADDFNTCDLDPMWSFDDPLADGGAYAMANTYTDSAGVALTVAAGTKHQLFNGVITAPHILQPATDHDLTVEVQFGSALPGGYTQEGLFFRQDDDTFVGFEFYSSPSGQPNAYIRVPDDSVIHNVSVGAPGDLMAMRVERVGDTWTQYWSDDGVTFTQVGGSFAYALNVTGFGVFAGNTGSSPVGHTVLVDYVSNIAGPPAGEDALINELTVIVAGNGTVLRTPDLLSYGCDETVVLTAVPDPGWTFDGWTGALTGTANPDSLVMSGSTAVTATFSEIPLSFVAAETDGACLSPADPCVEGVPFVITREEFTGLREYSVTFGLTDLDLCAGVGSVTEGEYLSDVGATTFQVTDNLDGTWTVDAAIVGMPCGAADTTGVLFRVDAAHTVPDGVGVLSVVSVTLTDCDSAPVTAAPGDPATILIDSTPPASAVANLAAIRKTVGNAPDSTTVLTVSWDAVADPDVDSLTLYRKGFGTYPEYDDTGAPPTLPSDPIGEGWQLVASLPAASVTLQDTVAVRDYWSYVAVPADSCGNVAVPVEMTSGTLNYLLGDVVGHAVVPDAGDNMVGLDDLAAFGTGYGSSDGDGSGFYDPVLDIGPTGDTTPEGLPVTDDVVEFEDLMIFALSYGFDATAPTKAPVPATSNQLLLTAPAPPLPGLTYEVSLAMSADGTLQGLSVPLTWDPAVVQPVSMAGGDLALAQDQPYLVIAPEPGIMDFALMGPRTLGVSGTGMIAVFTFEVLSAGDPAIGIGTVRARDAVNQPVIVPTGVTTGIDDLPGVPAVTALHAPAPNPFNPSTTVSFDMAREGSVRVRIYGVDGRLVRTLVDGVLPAGRYEEVWNGRDDQGRGVASGTYLMRLESRDATLVRRMALIK